MSETVTDVPTEAWLMHNRNSCFEPHGWTMSIWCPLRGFYMVYGIQDDFGFFVETKAPWLR